MPRSDRDHTTCDTPGELQVCQGCHYSTERHGIYIPEHFNTLFSGTEQLFNISLHVNSSCLGLWSDIYSYCELHIYALHIIFYACRF